MYILGAIIYILGAKSIIKVPICTLKVYLLKRYSPSDSFWTFFSESVKSAFLSFFSWIENGCYGELLRWWLLLHKDLKRNEAVVLLYLCMLMF